jgi:hypothetical protein
MPTRQSGAADEHDHHDTKGGSRDATKGSVRFALFGWDGKVRVTCSRARAVLPMSMIIMMEHDPDVEEHLAY